MQSLISRSVEAVRLEAMGICTEMVAAAQHSHLPSVTISKITKLSHLIGDLCDLVKEIEQNPGRGGVTMDEVMANFVPVTQTRYDNMVRNGTIDHAKYYMIVG